jgi:hypothetical protein
VIGTITEEVYEFWSDRDDLDELASDWDGEMDIPTEMRFITDGAWHDIDDLCHEAGCDASAFSTLQVWDSVENASIFECSTDLDALDQAGVSTDCHWHRRPREDCKAGTCVFVGQSIEKGTFFSGTIRITAPFDPAKLAISWHDCDGWRLITSVEYDGEEVEGGDGYSTTGKGMEFQVYRVADTDEEPDYDHPEANFDDDYDIGVMEGEEIWSSRVIDTAAEVEQWEGHALTPWWSADETPRREGRYQVLVGTWPFPSFARYTNKQGWRDEDGAIDDLKSWRGLAEPAE